MRLTLQLHSPLFPLGVPEDAHLPSLWPKDFWRAGGAGGRARAAEPGGARPAGQSLKIPNRNQSGIARGLSSETESPPLKRGLGFGKHFWLYHRRGHFPQP